MATTRRFSAEQQNKVIAQLEVPFDEREIKWRVWEKRNNGRWGGLLPYADPRAYIDRLNQLFSPVGWTKAYVTSTVPGVRTVRNKLISTSKILVTTTVTIHRLGTHPGTGEEWADEDNAFTSADAQSFKRACSCFGLGRYLYRFGLIWVKLDRDGVPIKLPGLPQWALPPGAIASPAAGAIQYDVRGPIDSNLTARIQSYRSVLGQGIYTEILERAGHCNAPQNIPNADRQKNTVEWMGAAERGLERLRTLAEIAGDSRFIATMDEYRIGTAADIPSLQMLKRLIEALETSNQQAA
jgi:hypothetical protein